MYKYRQSQLRKELRIPEATLRYWLNSFKKFFSPSTIEGKQYYSKYDLYKLRIIKSMRLGERKHSYKNIQRALKDIQDDLENLKLLNDFLNKLK